MIVLEYNHGLSLVSSAVMSKCDRLAISCATFRVHRELGKWPADVERLQVTVPDACTSFLAQRRTTAWAMHVAQWREQL
jgi:hypothetical protein